MIVCDVSSVYSDFCSSSEFPSMCTVNHCIMCRRRQMALTVRC